MLRTGRAILLAALILVVTGAGLALAAGDAGQVAAKPRETTMRLIPLKNVRATTLAALFSGESLPTGRVAPPGALEFIKEVREDALRDLRVVPEKMTEPGLYPYPGRVYLVVRPGDSSWAMSLDPEPPKYMSKGLAGLLPPDMEKPVAFVDDNSLMVRGSPEAIDQFQEIVSLFDKPRKQVNLQFCLMNLRGLLGEPSGPEDGWRTESGQAPVARMAPLPQFGVLDRTRPDPVGTLVAGSTQASAAITVANNTACLVRAASVTPFVEAEIAGGDTQKGRMEYRTRAATPALEIVLVPRVNEDNSLDLLVTYTNIDPSVTTSGHVRAPDGSVMAIHTHNTVGRRIRVSDGQTAVLSGLPRAAEALAKVGPPVHPPTSGGQPDTETLLFITANVVQPAPEGNAGALPGR